MPVTTTQRDQTMRLPVFVASDGREFVPDTTGASLDRAIDNAKSAAEMHERIIAERTQMAVVCERLFGEKSADVLDALWTDKMRYFARRLDVLRTLDKIVNASK